MQREGQLNDGTRQPERNTRRKPRAKQSIFENQYADVTQFVGLRFLQVIENKKGGA
jgi:hypothetical protein